MEQTHIVTALDLDAFAETKLSEGAIPELIWLLINQSVSDLTRCRIPYGDAVSQVGYDGLVETLGFKGIRILAVRRWPAGARGNAALRAVAR